MDTGVDIPLQRRTICNDSLEAHTGGGGWGRGEEGARGGDTAVQGDARKAEVVTSLAFSRRRCRACGL